MTPAAAVPGSLLVATSAELGVEVLRYAATTPATPASAPRDERGPDTLKIRRIPTKPRSDVTAAADAQTESALLAGLPVDEIEGMADHPEPQPYAFTGRRIA